MARPADHWGYRGVPNVKRKCGCPALKLSELPRSEVDCRLWRADARLDKHLDWSSRLGGKWGCAFSAYLRLLPGPVRPQFRAVFSGRFDICEDCWLAELKALTRSSLAAIIEGGLDWTTYLLDLYVLGGFDTTANRRDPMLDVKADYCTPSPVKPCESLLRRIDDVVGRIKVRPVDISFTDFVSFRDEWAQPGTSNLGAPAVLRIGDKTRKVNNKWFSSLCLSDDDVVRECNKRETVVKPFRKSDEPGKTRTVQAYDTRSIIRCSYLEKAVADWNGREQWTSVGFGPREKSAMRSKIWAARGSWMICTDQSSFDINQPKWAVVYALRAIISHLAKAGGSPDLARVAAIESQSLDHVSIVLDGELTPWEKGVLSGHRWTSILDSVLNCAESEECLARQGIDVNWGLYQGDDALVSCKSRPCPDRLAADYASMGLEVNPLKTWLSDSRCEYLHEIYSDGRVAAFPARTVRSVLWRSPMTKSEAGGSGPLLSRVALYSRLSRRGLCGGRDLARRLLRGVIPKHKWDDDAFNEWLDSPTSLGGGGFNVWGRRRLLVDRPGFERVRITVDSPVATGWHPETLSSAVKVRCDAGGYAIPGTLTEYRFVRVAKAKTFSSGIVLDVGRGGGQRRSWEVEDSGLVASPYLLKLNLERKLLSREEIKPNEIPPGILRSSPLGADRAFRIFQRWAGQGFSFGTPYSDAERYSGVSSLVKDFWDAVVVTYSMEPRSALRVPWDGLKDALAAIVQWGVGLCAECAHNPPVWV